MLFMDFTRLKTYLLRTLALGLVLIALFWGACHLFLPQYVQKTISSYGDKIGYEINYRKLSVSPLRLSVEVDGMHLSKKGGKDLLSFDKLVLVLKWTKLAVGELGFDEILLEAPKITLEKISPRVNAKREPLWNWEELISAVKNNLPPNNPQASKTPLKISIDELKVHAATAHLLDPGNQIQEELKPFSIELMDVANYDKKGIVTGVRGQYDFNLGSLQALIPGLKKTVSFQHVAVSGSLDNPEPNLLGAQINLKLDEGDLHSHWTLNTASKLLEGKLEIQKLATAPFIPLLPANKELVGVSGFIDANVLVKVGGDSNIISGSAQWTDLLITESGKKTPFLAWKLADFRQFEYQMAKADASRGSSLTLGECVIDQPSLQFEINEEGFSNFRRLFSPPANTNAVASSEQVSQISQVGQVSEINQIKQKGPFALDIRSINLKNGEVFFSDLSMKPNFKVDIKKFNATLLGVSNTPGRSAVVAADGVVAGVGSLKAKGRASFDDPRRNHDIAVNFRNLPLTSFNPAVMTFAGYEIVGGRLSLNLIYRSKDGDLNGSNQIIIKQVKLGNEVPDFKGKKLPLGLAIALLEDSDDTIDITIQIAGNVDSPEFSASGLVWQAIGNVLTNIATAPFRALASLIGISATEGVNAVLGEAVFLPVDLDNLEKFGQYLVKRPNANLEIIGTYDPVKDKQELARVRADTAILNDAGFKLKPGEPVPAPSFADPRVQSGLRAAYAQYVGRIQLGQRLLMLPEGDARNEQLHNELIAAIEVSDAELKELAKNRARVAYDAMVKDDPSLKARILLGDVKTVDAGKEGVPLDVEIKIK